MLKCLIIDDEPLARECIANYAGEVDFLQLVGTGSNPLELTRLLEANEVDLVFLDIQMPVMNGIDFLKTALRPPMVIITTAYPSYALEGFQLDVLDYLVKPITFTRFFKAATKARDYRALLARPATSTATTQDYFFVKCDHKFEKIHFSEILHIQALENYVVIHTDKGRHITLLSLKTVEHNLDPRSFIRVHKSYIVAIAKIRAIENNEIIIGMMRIPVSRNYREELLGRVVNKRLWKKPGEG